MHKDIISLESQVKKYQEQRHKRWKAILIISMCILCLLLGLITSGVVYYVRHVRKKSQQLTSEHTSLTHQWRLFQMSSKQLKALKAAQEPSQLASYVKTISETIPKQTLLTTLIFDDPCITLQGYTNSLEELGLFMRALMNKNVPVTLKKSYPMGPLFFYELTTANLNSPKVSRKKHRKINRLA